MLRVVVCSGSLEAEARLVSDLSERIPRTPEALLRSGTLRILVPSNALRLHLLARVVQDFGAWTGLHVLTLGQLSREILEVAAESWANGELLYPVVCSRAWKRHLSSGPFPGGTRALEGSVRDLLDAGFEAAHLAAALELVEAAEAKLSRRFPWAETVLKCAAELAAWLEESHLFVGAGHYRAAARALLQEGNAFDFGDCWIHGFADATGAATDLLEQIARTAREARLYLDLPPDPRVGLRSVWSERFGQAFRHRLLGLGSLEEPSSYAAEKRPTLRTARAPTEKAEVEWVAQEIRHLLDDGFPPERIAVVARDLAPYLPYLRRDFERWAIPYSVFGATEPTPLSWHLGSLSDWLELGGELPISSVLSLLEPQEKLGVPLSDAIRALRRKGWLHLRDVPCEVPQQMQEDPLLVDLLRAVCRAAAALKQWKPHNPSWDSLENWLLRLRNLLRQAELPSSLEATLFDGLEDRLGSGVSRFQLQADEFQLVLIRHLEQLGSRPLEASGTGVQIASVTAFRGRTTEHLFLLGLRHGLFPRIPHEDPLLPDLLRLELQSLLPDLAPKRIAADEEPFLFDQLVSAVSKKLVALSPSTSLDGKAYLPSPFQDRLSAFPSASSQPWSQALDADRSLLHPAALACRSGTRGDVRSWARWVPAALAALTDRPLGEVRSEARALIHWVRAREPRPREIGLRRLLPWLGFLATPLPKAPSVTRLERQLGCGWQSYLADELQLDREELSGIPDPFEPRRVGHLLHRTLESLLSPGVPHRCALESALLKEPRTPPVVDDEALHRAIQTTIEEAVGEWGLHGWGVEPLLKESLIPLVLSALSRLPAETQLIGVELQGTARWERPVSPMKVAFRVDRVERTEAGTLRFVDYKTGSLPSKLPKAIAQGTDLQVPVYLQSLLAQGGGEVLFQRIPASSEDPVFSTLDPACPELLKLCEEVVSLAMEARELGLLPPLLFHSDHQTSNPACAECSFLAACVQEDGTVRTLVSNALSYLATQENPELDNELRLLVELLERPRAQETSQARIFPKSQEPLPHEPRASGS